MSYYKKTRYCSVPGCFNTSKKNPKMGFFFNPQNPKRAEEWFLRTHHEDLYPKKVTVCGAHFDPEMVQYFPNSIHLKPDAIPIFNLPKLRKNLTIDDDTTSQAVQTDALQTAEKCLQTTFKSNNAFISKRKRQLLQKIKRNLKLSNPDLQFSKNYQFEMYKYEILIKKYLPENLGKFIILQQNLSTPSPKDQYTDEYKKFLLHLYYTSSHGYTLTQKLLSLPSQTTLKDMFTPQSMAVDQRLMQILKCKVDLMTNEQKQCTVCVSMIKLKPNLYYNVGRDRVYGFHVIDGELRPEPAKVALVVMACGLYKKWEQLISMVALSNATYTTKVTAWVTKILSNLINIGLNVRAFVTEIDIAYTYIFTERVTLLTPYIFINSRKIYVIFDVPHLMKEVRNTFMANNFYFDGKFAYWSDVVLCYEHDKKKDLLRLLPKITDVHIEPKDYQKDVTKLALQIMSFTYSAVISNYVDLKILNDSAKGTSEFLQKMNNLFDILNSNSKTTNNKYKKPFTGDSFQNSFLTDMMSFFRDIIIVKNTENDPHASFIEGFQTTICSILQLYAEIKVEYDHLYTRRLNLDNLNKFLKKIVEHEGEYPTMRQLTIYFREKFSSDILQSPVTCKPSDNMEDIMILTQNLVDMKICTPRMSERNKYSNIKIDGALYKKLKIPDDNTLMFLAEFLFVQCYTKHNECEELNKYLASLKMFETASTVPVKFINFVNLMETRFRQHFLRNQLSVNILQELLEDLDDVPYDEMPCSHFPVLYAKKFYARLRIFMMLKFNNKSINK